MRPVSVPLREVDGNAILAKVVKRAVDNFVSLKSSVMGCRKVFGRRSNVFIMYKWSSSGDRSVYSMPSKSHYYTDVLDIGAH